MFTMMGLGIGDDCDEFCLVNYDLWLELSMKYYLGIISFLNDTKRLVIVRFVVYAICGRVCLFA